MPLRRRRRERRPCATSRSRRSHRSRGVPVDVHRRRRRHAAQGGVKARARPPALRADQRSLTAFRDIDRQGKALRGAGVEKRPGHPPTKPARLQRTSSGCASQLLNAPSRLDVAVLHLGAERHGPRSHAEVLHQRHILGIEWPLAIHESAGLVMPAVGALWPASGVRARLHLGQSSSCSTVREIRAPWIEEGR